MNKQVRRAAAATASILALSATLAACGSGSGSGGGDADGKTVTLVTHDSFAASQQVLRKFTEQTGYKVKVLRGGDAGAAVNQAVLNKSAPQGDLFFGVDNTLLSRPLKEGVFAPYRAKDLDRVPKALQLDADRHRVTPVDTGEICVNYDRAYFAKKKLAPPSDLADLADPRYRNLLVTENAATSSPGLGFLLATVDAYGTKDATGDGWLGYWKKLKANGVEVVDSWEQAYNDRFSGSQGGRGKGDRPLVVSYASSPPAEVVGKKPLPRQAPTGIATGTCFQQTEFAGVLTGARNPAGAKALLDYMLGSAFQQDMPLQMFVDPVRRGTALPEVFARYEEHVAHPAAMAPQRIADNRDQWVDTWSQAVLH